MTSASLPTTPAQDGRLLGESQDPIPASEAAQVLQIGNYRMLQLCRSGEIRAYKPGKAWLIYRDDLNAYIKAHSNQTGESA